jgi:biopolymer transport protein ExbD
MGFGQFNSQAHNSSISSSTKPLHSMSDINVTPMVDVMLVLLVIFIIAAPLLNHAVKLDLPQANSAAADSETPSISLSFDAQGVLYWEGKTISFAEFEKNLALLKVQQPQPEILLRADKQTRYEIIAQVMAAAQAQGLSKIGFVTEEVKAAKVSAQ